MTGRKIEEILPASAGHLLGACAPAPTFRDSSPRRLTSSGRWFYGISVAFFATYAAFVFYLGKDVAAVIFGLTTDIWPQGPSMQLGTWVTGAVSIVLMAVALLLSRRSDMRQPQVTFVKSGSPLIGVLISSVAFNLPGQLSMWAAVAGIALTLLTLPMTWHAESVADADAAEFGLLRGQLNQLRRSYDQQRSKQNELTNRMERLLQQRDALLLKSAALERQLADVDRQKQVLVHGLGLALSSRSGETGLQSNTKDEPKPGCRAAPKGITRPWFGWMRR